MRKRLMTAGVASASLGLLALAYLARLVDRLDTPEFKHALLEQAGGALGVQVRAQELRISLLSGVTLSGVGVANPPGFPGELLTADAFRLRYDLVPLLRGRLQIDELVLERPILRLATNARGVFNYERLGAGAASRAAGPAASLPIALSLSRLSVEGARVSVVDHARTPLLTLTDLGIESSLTLAGGQTQGRGRASLGALALLDRLFLREVSAPIELSEHAARLAPIQATLADGRATGALELDLARGFRFALSLELAGAKVEKLLAEAGSGGLAGSLRARASLEGTDGLPTLKGRGSAQVGDCRVRGSKVLGVLAVTLQLPELAAPDFHECRAEFTLARGRAETPVLSLKGASMQLTGRGASDLTSRTLDYDMTLALSQALVDRLPVKEVRAAFKERDDSFATLDFKVTGTTDAPRTDIAARIAKAGATEAIKGAVRKLFRRNR